MNQAPIKLVITFWTLFTFPSVAQTAAEKMSALGYPAIPASIRGEKSTRNPNSIGLTAPAHSGDWALADIGFFRVFNPLFQAIDPKTTPCSKSTIVAVVDTGIDYTHADLVDALWVNQGEVGQWAPQAGWVPPAGIDALCRDRSCNGIDDDANGFADDVIGWDFVHNIAAPYDIIGHGSHIAGIIAATGRSQMSGVCSGASIMTLKYYDPTNPGANNLSNLVRSIHYAAANGADIINFSGGGVEPAESELKAVRAAREMGVLIVTAAGNQGRSNDLFGSYPANYPVDNILSVASVDSENKVLPSSNYGQRVHLAAPGSEILSTLPQGGLGRLTGTSQATAYVTGAAAFLMSQLGKHTSYDYIKIKSWLTRGAKSLPSPKVIAHGLLSLPDSLKLLRAEEAHVSKN
ncbi:MAG: S8 family serine peptidase [Deltaproteobacteria bacterium]|nr:S8 family serine peptidase [Deltaproteobacteria bacterium]MBI3295718.1 S8 family serine peptidase [Deltaproteobacteria bacterium]